MEIGDKISPMGGRIDALLPDLFFINLRELQFLHAFSAASILFVWSRIDII